MKITRKQLTKIVQEELKLVAEAKKKKKKVKAKSDYHGNETLEDAWSGGDNLVDPKIWDKELDMIKEESPSSALSASQLQQLIYEELASVMAEVTRPLPVYEKDVYEKKHKYSKDYLSKTHPNGSGEEADPDLDFIDEDSGDDETQNYRDNEKEDEKHIKDLKKDIDFDKDHIR